MRYMKRVAIKTIGCKTNFADTGMLSSYLEKLGFEIVPPGKVPDVIIVNSCVVTQRAEADSRKALVRSKKMTPDARTILTGCGVFKNGKLRLADYADMLLPMEHQLNEEKIKELLGNHSVEHTRKNTERIPLSRAERSRIFVKIQNGCDNSCSYCIVPSVRGKSVSRHHDDVLKEILAWEEDGFLEVVLTGNHIGSYGGDLPNGMPLSALVELIVKRTNQIRIRLSSIEVDEVDDHLLEMLVGEKRLCNHLHIPLQSGDDLILKRMGRWYPTEEYRTFVERIKRSSNEICIGTDIITGFPGESDDSFEKTFNYFSSLPLDYAHVFTFSPREGTEAASMRGQVADGKKKERTALLRGAGEEKRKKFIDYFIGKSLEVVMEKESPKSRTMQGTSDNYIKVIWHGHRPDHTMLVTVHIEGRNGDRAVGTHRPAGN
jgi:threonylcarbamoyladenosine tRNA methylthiotransferase MtaB